jgi:hypothetical protein
MKCDELESKTIYEGYPGCYTEHVVYDKADVDDAISEMKAALKIKDDLLIENGAEIGRLNAEIKRLKAEAEQEIRHYKRKCCRAMANMSSEKAGHYRAEYDAEEGFGDGWLKWIRWAKKWSSRWTELADKFRG